MAYTSSDYLIPMAIFLAIVIVLIYVSYIIFFNIKKKQFDELAYIALCPNCGSLDAQDVGMWAGGVAFPFGPSTYKCMQCGYQGGYVQVEKDKVKDFRKKIKAKIVSMKQKSGSNR